MRSAWRRAIGSIGLMLGVSLFSACQSAKPTDREPHAGTGDGLSDTDASRTAAEDADSLNLKPSTTQPSRRPPPTPQRRPVDQPRVRG